MADRKGAAVAEGANGESQGGGASGAEKKAAPGIYIPLPDVLRTKLEEEAKASGKSVREVVRSGLAAHWGVELPAPQPRTKYASEEEKQAALKAKNRQHHELVKLLLRKHKYMVAGKTDEEATQLAQADIERENAEKAAKAAATVSGSGTATSGSEETTVAAASA